jgi:hypothetical protein
MTNKIGWALTPNGHRLAYGTLRDWDDDNCYPGNSDWIRDHQLNISCHLEVSPNENERRYKSSIKADVTHFLNLYCPIKNN